MDRSAREVINEMIDKAIESKDSLYINVYFDDEDDSKYYISSTGTRGSYKYESQEPIKEDK